MRQADEDTSEEERGEIEAVIKLTAGMKRRIKRELSNEKPTIWIGKSGASEQVLGEIGKQLEKKEMIKVKILRSALAEEAKQIASRIAEQTESSLVEVRGHSFILYKRRRKTKSST